MSRARRDSPKDDRRDDKGSRGSMIQLSFLASVSVVTGSLRPAPEALQD